MTACVLIATVLCLVGSVSAIPLSQVRDQIQSKTAGKTACVFFHGLGQWGFKKTKTGVTTLGGKKFPRPLFAEDGPDVPKEYAQYTVPKFQAEYQRVRGENNETMRKLKRPLNSGDYGPGVYDTDAFIVAGGLPYWGFSNGNSGITEKQCPGGIFFSFVDTNSRGYNDSSLGDEYCENIEIAYLLGREKGADRIAVFTHSMGNLVIAHALLSTESLQAGCRRLIPRPLTGSPVLTPDENAVWFGEEAPLLGSEIIYWLENARKNSEDNFNHKNRNKLGCYTECTQILTYTAKQACSKDCIHCVMKELSTLHPVDSGTISPYTLTCKPGDAKLKRAEFTIAINAASRSLEPGDGSAFTSVAQKADEYQHGRLCGVLNKDVNYKDEYLSWLGKKSGISNAVESYLYPLIANDQQNTYRTEPYPVKDDWKSRSANGANDRFVPLSSCTASLTSQFKEDYKNPFYKAIADHLQGTGASGNIKDKKTNALNPKAAPAEWAVERIQKVASLTLMFRTAPESL